MSTAETVVRILRWLPFALFALLVTVVIIGKYAGQQTQEVGVDAGQAAEECSVVCERLTVCALEFFGDTPVNRARLPQLREGCLVGCAKPATYVRIQGCFAEDRPADCPSQAQCAISVLYAP